MLQEHQITPYQCTSLPTNVGPWLVVAPHADDESFGMGGTLVKAQQQNIATHVVVLTDGALGGDVKNIVALRENEARAAAKLLGIKSIHFFAQPDRGLTSTTALQQRLLMLVQSLDIKAIFFPGVMELHPDHRSTALLVWQCLQQLGDAAPQAIAYEITGQSPSNCLVDITDCMQQKLSAIAQYQSQLNENNYLEIVKALNKLRTLTLPPSVQWAESFYCFDKSEMQLVLPQWLQQQAAKFI